MPILFLSLSYVSNCYKIKIKRKTKKLQCQLTHENDFVVQKESVTSAV